MKIENQGVVSLKINRKRRSLMPLIECAIEEHHPEIRRQIAWLKQAFAKVIQLHEHEYPDLVPAYMLFIKMSDDLEKHMLKEESAIFPYLANGEKLVQKGEKPDHSTLNRRVGDNPLETILSEHEATLKDWRRLKKLASVFLTHEGACGFMDAVYWGLQRLDPVLSRHLESEVNDLYKLVEKEEWFGAPVI